MKTTSKLKIMAAVSCAAAIGCSDAEDGGVDAGGDRLATPVSSEKLPGLEHPIAHECSTVQNTQVSVEEWVAGADAIIIGTIADIEMSDLAFVSRIDWEGPEVIPVERCREEWRGSLSGFRIKLTDVTSITGDVPETLYIYFGHEAMGTWERDAAPVVRDYEITWKDESRRLESGMRIGGAVYEWEEHGIFTFGTYYSQAFFVEENGRVFFQPYIGPHCAALIPPIDALGGRESTTVAARLVAAALSVDPLQSESSELRRMVLLEDRPEGPWPPCFFPGCTPEDYESN